MMTARPSGKTSRAVSAAETARAFAERICAPFTPRTRVRVSRELTGTGFEGDLPDIESFAPFLPYDAMIDEHFTALSAAHPAGPEGIGFTIEITPQTGVTEEMEKTLAALFQTPVPIGSTFAVTVYASPAIESLLDVWVKSHEAGLAALSPEAAAVARRSALGRAELLRRAAREQILPHAPAEARHFRAWISCVLRVSDPWSPKALEAAKRAARAIDTVLSQNLLSGGLWTGDDYVRTLTELLNPQIIRANPHAERLERRHDASRELRAQLISRTTEITIAKDGVRFAGGTSASGRNAAGVTAVGLSAEHYPPKMSLARFSLLLGEPGRSGAQIPCPFLLTAFLEAPDTAAEKTRVNAMAVRTRQMMGTPVGALIPHYHDAWKNYSAAAKSFDGAGGVARVLHQMVLLAPAGREADCIQSAQALGRKLSVDLQENTALHAQALLTVLPCAAGPALVQDLVRMQRLSRRTAGTVACGLPVMTEYRGTGPRPGAAARTPLLMLCGRKGQIFFADLFANSHGSYSATVVGKPGSGKSVVMNELAASALMTGGRVWVIDAGYSYQKLCGVMGGAFYEFTDGQAWNLDPFEHLIRSAENSGNDEGDAAEMLEMVVRVIAELMTPRGISDYAESILSRCVLETAAALSRASAEERRRVSGMERLRRALLAYRLAGSDGGVTERQALEMAAMLEPYAEGGAFARWFDGTGRAIDFSSARLNVLELDGLSAHRRLRAGVLMTLMLTIEREMRLSPKSEAKLVLIDEAWDLMGEGASGKFIETGYRRARKLNGAFVTATQSIADFHLSETAEAAWRCADTRIFLRQDPDSLEALEHDGRLARDPWLKEAISSLTTVAGAWSEMVIKVGDDPAAIGRLILDPYSRVAYSTLPAEVDAVERWRRAGATLAEAIEFTALGKVPPAC